MSSPESSGHQNASQRRGAVRTAVVWEALRELLDSSVTASRGGAGHAPLRVLDIGGGTGGFAVRVAELDHQVTVVDPNPDALATLARRSEETGVADRITGIQGELATLMELVHGDPFDVVLCHGVLEVVDDPKAAMAAVAGVLRSGGRLSLLVSQRHAAVVARAMAGHFGQARALLDGAPTDGRPPHRFTADDATGLLTAAGFEDVVVHAVRVFSDLVPSSLVDLEPGAATALVDLEHAVSTRSEYLTLATQLHALATLR